MIASSSHLTSKLLTTWKRFVTDLPSLVHQPNGNQIITTEQPRSEANAGRRIKRRTRLLLSFKPIS